MQLSQPHAWAQRVPETYVHMNTHTGACTVGCIPIIQSHMQIDVI